MTKEEIIQAAQKESAYQLDIGSNAPLSIQEGFIKGAEWMQERMIEKAAEWIRTNWREYINGPDKDGCIAFAHWENDFRRAMGEKNERRNTRKTNK